MSELVPRDAAPHSLSKSLSKALACEWNFTHNYAVESAPIADAEVTRTGTDFHRYRSEYVDHLVRERKRSDPDWAWIWLERNHDLVTDDARWLIKRDVGDLTIDPEAILATELFLSLDERFGPLEQDCGSRPGRGPLDPRAAYHGTVDLLTVREEPGENGRPSYEASIFDAKSGRTSAYADDYEALHYAMLVFAHFPYLDRVTFEWEFIRAEGRPGLVVGRDQLPEIQTMAQRKRAAMLDLVARFRAGATMTANPLSGLCPMCALDCPMRRAIIERQLVFPPPQTVEDAKALAAMTYVADWTAKKGKELLRAYLQATGGELDAGDGLVAEIHKSSYTVYSLRSALAVLGVEVPAQSPKWNVPLDSLTIGSTKLKDFAETKKRRGLADELVQVAGKSRPRTEVRVRKRSEPEVPDHQE